MGSPRGGAERQAPSGVVEPEDTRGSDVEVGSDGLADDDVLARALHEEPHGMQWSGSLILDRLAEMFV